MRSATVNLHDDNLYIKARFQKIASEIAARHADDVDRSARFPGEVFNALQSEKLLCWFGVDHPFPLAESAVACYELARFCASSGLIFAMHHSQLATLRAHISSEWQQDLIADIAQRQWLIGSSTSEDGPPSALLLASDDAGGFLLQKNAPTISYAEHADVLLTTTGGCAMAGHPAKVMVALPTKDLQLQHLGQTTTAGMRGTCSRSYTLNAIAEPGQVLREDVTILSTATMLPISHVLWASVWLGIAASALAIARDFVRKHRNGPSVSARRRHLGQAEVHFSNLRAQLHWAIGSLRTRGASTVHGTTTDMNVLKVAASQNSIAVVTEALLTCGIAGYREDGPYSLGRSLRDIYSSCLMIHNDSLLENVGAMNSVAALHSFP